MQDGKMILYNQDGTETVLVNPFGPLKALYDDLRKDPNAETDLSAESKAAILREIADGTAPKPAMPTCRKRHKNRRIENG